MILFTVVIPAFNVGPYIKKTFESLEAQNLNSEFFEVIVINDGSTDETRAVVSSFVSRGIIDIHVFDQDNAGVSSARNLGIRKARGRYIYFLDGDDYISEHFLFLLKERIDQTGPELLITSYFKVSNGEVVRRFSNRSIYKVAEDIKISYLNGELSVQMCTFVFRKSDIMRLGLAFDSDTQFGEDLEFYQKFLFSSFSIDIVEEAVFYYVYRPSSALNSLAGIEREDSLKALFRVECYLEENGEKSTLLDIYRNRFIPVQVLKVIQAMVNSGDLSLAARIAGKSKYREILKKSDLEGRQKLKAKISCSLPWVYVAIMYLVFRTREKFNF